MVFELRRDQHTLRQLLGLAQFDDFQFLRLVHDVLLRLVEHGRRRLASGTATLGSDVGCLQRVARMARRVRSAFRAAREGGTRYTAWPIEMRERAQ